MYYKKSTQFFQSKRIIYLDILKESYPSEWTILSTGMLSLNQMIDGVGFPIASQKTENLSPILAM